MSKFNLKQSVAVVIAALGGRDVLADQIRAAHEAYVSPQRWYTALSSAVVQDHVNGIDHPQLSVVTAQREQTSGLNAGIKAGDLMLDLSKGQGKAVKNRVSQWENAVSYGIDPRVEESTSAWLGRASSFPADWSSAVTRLISCGYSIPMNIGRSAFLLGQFQALADMAEQPNAGLIEYQEKLDAELKAMAVLEKGVEPAPVTDAAPVEHEKGQPKIVDFTGKQVSKDTRIKIEKGYQALEKSFSKAEMLALTARMIAGLSGASFEASLASLELTLYEIAEDRKIVNG